MAAIAAGAVVDLGDEVLVAGDNHDDEPM